MPSPYPSNAALEWQARCMGWHSRGLVVACPLEGLVRQSSIRNHSYVGLEALAQYLRTSLQEFPLALLWEGLLAV
jgi:hypothetical protein